MKQLLCAIESATELFFFHDSYGNQFGKYKATAIIPEEYTFMQNIGLC